MHEPADPSQGRGQQVPLHHRGRAARQAAPERAPSRASRRAAASPRASPCRKSLAEAVSWEVARTKPPAPRPPSARGVGAVPVVVLGVTGCIGGLQGLRGAARAAEARRGRARGDDAATRRASSRPMTFEALSRHPVFVDQFALGEDGDIRHISLADAADLLLVAPATANTLGKFAHGIADDALSHALPRDARAGAGRAGHERQHVRPPRGAGEPRHAARARRGRRRAGLGLPGLRLAGQGPAGRGARRSWRRRSPCSRAARDLAGETVLVTAGPDRRGHRPGALRVEPLDRADGLPAGRGRPRPRAPASCSSPVRPRCRRRAGVTLVAVRSAEEMQRAVAAHAGVGEPTSWPWRPRCPTTARRTVAPAKVKKTDGPAAAGAGAHARHPARRWARRRARGSWSASPRRRRTWSRTRARSARRRTST